jgi:cytosine/adenosine deaminase-related metal-dependent hydrolase
VGLGTDVGAGASCSMLDSMRQALIASRVCAFSTSGANVKLPAHSPLSLAEVFHLATQGGAEALGLGTLTAKPDHVDTCTLLAVRLQRPSLVN